MKALSRGVASLFEPCYKLVIMMSFWMISLVMYFWAVPFDDSTSDWAANRGFEDIGLVDVNSASYSTLLMVPYMTPGLADCILENRPFEDMDELKRKCGVSDWYARQLKPYLVFSGKVSLRMRMVLSTAAQKGYGNIYFSHRAVSGGAGLSSASAYWFFSLNLPYGFDVTVGKMKCQVPIGDRAFWRPSSYGVPAIAVHKPGWFAGFAAESTFMVALGGRVGIGLLQRKPSDRLYFAFGRFEAGRMKLGVAVIRDTAWNGLVWLRAGEPGGYVSFVASTDAEMNRLNFSVYPRTPRLWLGVYAGGYTGVRLTVRPYGKHYFRLRGYLKDDREWVRFEYESRYWLKLLLRADRVYDADEEGSILSVRAERGHLGVSAFVYSLGERQLSYWEPDGTAFPLSGSGSRLALYGWWKLRRIRLSWKAGYSSAGKLDFSIGVRYSNVEP